MPYPNVGMLCPFLGALCAFLGMLYSFAATLCEGEDAIHEELSVHHALHGVPDPFRGRGSECVGSPSERETIRPAYVGMPREDNPVRTMQSRRSRKHLPSLQRFALEELARRKHRLAVACGRSVEAPTKADLSAHPVASRALFAN
jgi:hypothetical protein